MAELSTGTSEINTGVSDSVTSTNMLRLAVGDVDRRIETATATLRALGETSRNMLEQLGKIHAHVSDIAKEAQTVCKIGSSNEDGLKKITDATAAAHGWLQRSRRRRLPCSHRALGYLDLPDSGF